MMETDYELLVWFLLAFINANTAAHALADTQRYKDMDWAAGKWTGRILFGVSSVLFVWCALRFTMLALGWS